MNIGFLATFPDPNDPDTSKAGYNHVTGLIKLLSDNNKITLFTISKYKWRLDIPCCENIIYIRSPNQLMRWIILVREIIKHRKMLNLLIVFNPSVAMLPVVPLTMILPIPTLIEYMDRQTSPIYSRYKVMRLLGFFSERLFLLTMNNWLTDSKELENTIRRTRKNSNIMLCRIMISPPRSDGQATSLPLEIDTNNVNIAYSGALTYHYGVDILFDAFSRLPSDYLHLYITGYGPMKSILEERVRERNISNVTIIFLDNEAMDKFLSKMDILIIPYRKTKATRMLGFSSKIFSYMWAGKAIIATTSIAELSDVLEDSKAGVLIESDDELELRQALIELITDKEKRTRLGLNAKKYFDDNFSVDVVRPKLIEYLRNIAGAVK